MPFDWQSVVVTVIAFAAALVIVRRFLPARRTRPGTAGVPAASVACDHCETGARTPAAATREAGGRAATTPVVSVADLRATAKRH